MVCTIRHRTKRCKAQINESVDIMNVWTVPTGPHFQSGIPRVYIAATIILSSCSLYKVLEPSTDYYKVEGAVRSTPGLPRSAASTGIYLNLLDSEGCSCHSIHYGIQVYYEPIRSALERLRVLNNRSLNNKLSP